MEFRSFARRLARLMGPALVAGLVAAAVVQGHGGDITKIHACVDDVNGAINIAADPTGFGNPSSACRGGTHALDWSVQGPAGPTGPVGPAGPQGPKGPSGTSFAYGKSGNGDVTLLPGEPYKTVLDLSLPAGLYAVMAKTTLGNSQLGGNAFCRLKGGDRAVLRSEQPTDITVPLMALMSNPGVVKLQCKSNKATIAGVQFRKLVAIKLDGYTSH